MAPFSLCMMLAGSLVCTPAVRDLPICNKAALGMMTTHAPYAAPANFCVCVRDGWQCQPVQTGFRE